jgi:alkanesulfonate monooxygenase SsuD/methylene tetrahydromethanopterin reductase-like flavin-dependent oxidoreductase (luciferase family)
LGDLGHDLEFGAFLTPRADTPEAVVALAELCDGLGLELLGIQDHPYQPSFLETWTLLSALSSRTTGIKLVPDVANVVLRPPAVLARAAASLDILSGGRVELGVGAGAFPGPVAAMGGPSLSPGERVDALEEAIAVMRALWAPGPDVRWTAGSTGSTAPGRGRFRRTPSASGSVPTSRACSGSPAGSPTAGCRPSPTPPPRRS